MFELTNAQRKCFALPEVQPEWKKISLSMVSCDLFEIIAYIDGNRICKVIQVGDLLYHEYSVNETISDDCTLLLPKTAKGKAVRLTAASLIKRNATAMGLLYHRGNIVLYHADARQNYYQSSYEGVTIRDMDAFRQWIAAWCRETGEKELADIAAFSKQKRVHQAYKEGDFFRFRINRKLFGYGRILLDWDRMRKEQIPFWDVFMGKPLCVGVYHIATERSDVSLDELVSLAMLPTQMIMDNILYYGECEIIGNRPIMLHEADYPIHYGRSITAGDQRIMYQCGKTFLTLENADEICCGYRSNGVGFALQMRLPVLQACIAAKSNLPFWEQQGLHMVQTDLRNPKNADIRKRIRDQFGLE